MHVCTYNVLGTEMAPIRWNGPLTLHFIRALCMRTAEFCPDAHTHTNVRAHTSEPTPTSICK